MKLVLFVILLVIVIVSCTKKSAREEIRFVEDELKVAVNQLEHLKQGMKKNKGDKTVEAIHVTPKQKLVHVPDMSALWSQIIDVATNNAGITSKRKIRWLKSIFTTAREAATSEKSENFKQLVDRIQ